MEAARRMKEVLRAPDEVTEVLKALISSGGGVPHLIDASTGKMKMNKVGVEVLKDKYVLLLITGPKICWRHLYKMRSIYDGIARSDLLEMVWLPSEKQEKEEGEEEEEKERATQLIELRSQMPRCVLQYFSPVKGINEIIKASGLMNGEIVVMIDPQGDIISQYRCLPDLWPILPAEKMDRWKGIKEHLHAPNEIIAVLKALISAKDDVLCLSGTCTDQMGRPANKRVSIDVLRGKYVLLFVSDLNIDSSVIRKMWSIYSGILNTDLVKLVWIPIVEKWTNELGKDFESLQSEMQRCILQPIEDIRMVLIMEPSCMEQDVSQAEGLKFIKEWGLQDVPLVLLMNPYGDVLSNHALQLPRIDKEPRAAPDMKEYPLYWGSKYAYWRERLFRAMKAMDQDPIIKKAEISISLSPVERGGETEGVSGSFNWKVQRLFHPFKNENKWALLVSKSFTEICAGPLILNVMEAFHVWKVNITQQIPFESCFKAYNDELSRVSEAFVGEEKESEDLLDNETKTIDFSDDESESDDETETKSEDFSDNENGEQMEAARKMEDILGVPGEVTEVLKALISSGGDEPYLIDASTKEMKQVSIDVLKDKYVLLLFSSAYGGYTYKGINLAKGIVKNDLLKIVWLPIVSWNDEAEDAVMERLAEMPWYVVQYFSPIAGMEFIEHEWGWRDYPISVLMNPKGNVLGKYVSTSFCSTYPITSGEKEEGWRMKEHFQAPDEITAVLKALISGSSDVLLLDDCSTKEMKQVSINVLREKFVLLLISGLEIPSTSGSGWFDCWTTLLSIYDGILKKDLVRLVWIPIVEQWTDKLQSRFEMLRSQMPLLGMPCYSVQCISPVAGLKFMEEQWFSPVSPQGNPILVLMSPQGNVLSGHRMNLFTSDLAGGGGGPHEIQDYTFYWRTKDKKWRKEFLELTEKVARDPIIKGKNMSIKCRRFESSTSNSQLQKSFDGEKSGDWAALEGPYRPIICEGPQILHVLRSFEGWKDDLRLNPFGNCFQNRYKELVNNVPTSRRR